MVQNGPYGRKWSKIVSKWCKMVKNGQNGRGLEGPQTSMVHMTHFQKKANFKKTTYFPKKTPIFKKNDKFSEKKHLFSKKPPFSKNDPFSKEGPIFKRRTHFQKMTIFKKKNLFSEKSAIFIGPDLKRARRNGLSAQGREGPSREARRASSQKLGPGGAPRLLVSYNS